MIKLLKSPFQMFSNGLAKLGAFFTVMMLSTLSYAQELPTIDSVDGLDPENSDPVDMFMVVFNYGATIVLWLFVVVIAFVMIKNIIKSINKVRRDEDGKWGDVVGEIIGNAVVVIVVIAFATWLQGVIDTAIA